MKKLPIIIISLLLVMCLADLSKAGDLEEIQALSDKYLKAMGHENIDIYVDIIHGSMGFNQVVSNVKDFKKPSKEMLRAYLGSWYKQNYDFFEMTSVSRDISIIGNTAITWGFIKCKYKHKGALSQMEEKHLRSTETYVKVDGKWKLVLFHRDTGVY